MARKPKQKLLTQLPAKFDPDFVERLSKRYSLTHVVQGRLAALEAHVGGAPSYVQRSLIRRTIWLELLTESYEQKVANGTEVDVGALTQLNNTLKGLYKDLGIGPTARPIESLHEAMAAAEAESEQAHAEVAPWPDAAPEPLSDATEGAP